VERWFSSALPVVAFPILMPMLACSSHCARLSFEQPSWWMFLLEIPSHFGGGEENKAANSVHMRPKEEGRDVFFHSILILRINNNVVLYFFHYVLPTERVKEPRSLPRSRIEDTASFWGSEFA
jgi:hypothetical protein